MDIYTLLVTNLSYIKMYIFVFTNNVNLLSVGLC